MVSGMDIRKTRMLKFSISQSLGTLASIAIRPASLTQTFEKLLVSSSSEEEEESDIATLGMWIPRSSRCTPVERYRMFFNRTQDNASRTPSLESNSCRHCVQGSGRVYKTARPRTYHLYAKSPVCRGIPYNCCLP